MIALRIMGAGVGVWCTGSSSQRLAEAPACLQALLSDVNLSRAAFRRSMFSLLRAVRTPDGCRARVALLLALHSAAVSVLVLRVRALLLLAVFSRLCASNSSVLVRALLLILSAALIGAVRL